MRSLPRVVSQIPSDLRNFLDRVREYLSEGGENRFVTVRELRAGGIVGTTPSGTITAPTEYTSVDPTIPTGLIASGALASIIIEWDPANYLGHSRTEIWAATTNNFALKELVGTSEGSVFSHSIGAGATWYYWIRFVSINEVAGPYNSTTGTVGVTSQDPDYLIEVLSDAYGVTSDAPFFQVDTPTVINGVTVPAGTYIKQAWIADATISRAKIQDLAVDSAKISDLAANKITAGNIQTGYIRSTTYTAGTAGWSINADGSAEFAQVAVRGTLYGGGATGYTTQSSGTTTGLFSGVDSTIYKWRVGNPTGARIQWTGTAIEVYNSSNVLTISSGGIQSISYADITGAKPPIDADKTSLNTAAAIAGQGSFATLSQITSANISTYIASAAIGTAQIANAAITNALIGTAAITSAKIGNLEVESANIANLTVGTGKIAYDSATVFDVFTIPTTVLSLPANTVNSTATTTLISSISGPATDISTQRVLLVSLKFSNYDSTPGYFQLNLPGRSFFQDVGTRLIDGSNINNFSYICPVTIAAGVTSIGSITLTLVNPASSTTGFWAGPPDCQGNVVLLTRKR